MAFSVHNDCRPLARLPSSWSDRPRSLGGDMRSRHREGHLVRRIGWLRAAVLGANDGIVSTASLIVGVAAAAATKNDVLLAGIAGLVPRPHSLDPRPPDSLHSP